MTFVFIYIASNWDNLSIIKNSVNYVLDPTIGHLLRWNLYIGLFIVIAITSLLIILAQKFLTNQEELKRLREKQKVLQAEMKKNSGNQEKVMELNREYMELTSKTFDLTLNSTFLTSPIMFLLFIWLYRYIYPIIGWKFILYSILGSITFSSIYKKILKVI